MLQPKDTEWENAYKNKTHIYAVYKKPTSNLKTHIDWKWEDGKIYSMQMGSKRKLDVFQRRYVKSQQVHEKILNPTSH